MTTARKAPREPRTAARRLRRSGTPAQAAATVIKGTGIWGTAKEVAGFLNKGGSAAINSLSCASASHCSGGGNYADRTFNNAQAFVRQQNLEGRVSRIAAVWLPGGPVWYPVTGGTIMPVSRRDSRVGVVVDVADASEAVAELVAGGTKERGVVADGALTAKIVTRAQDVFGSDARSVDALVRAPRAEPGAVTDLASALAWYAGRDQAFARELAAWAAKAGAGAEAGGVVQHIRAGRDVNASGRDQTVINYRRPGE
jgi:hypothetical protein